MLGLDQKEIIFNPTTFCLFFFTIISPLGQEEVRQESRRHVLGGQGEVCQGSRKRASGVKEKCIGGQGKVLPQNVWYLAEWLLCNP